MARRARAYKTSPDFCLNMQVNYDPWQNREQEVEQVVAERSANRKGKLLKLLDAYFTLLANAEMAENNPIHPPDSIR